MSDGGSGKPVVAAFVVGGFVVLALAVLVWVW